MRTDFGSMGEFAVHLAERAVAMYAYEQAGLERCVALIEKTARSEFGAYQSATGPFQAWDELAESTKDERVRLGYTENDPLLRSGDLRDSSQHEVEGLEAIAGSTSPIMPYQEFGTAKIPARPVWGPAAFRNKDKIERIIGAAAVSGIFGYPLVGGYIDQSLGYDFTT